MSFRSFSLCKTFVLPTQLTDSYSLIRYFQLMTTMPETVVHPKGSHARILLSSVFGPYAQDDEFGSRAINPMELYHNQVTRAQGGFSLRMFHRSWGIMMIQAEYFGALHRSRFSHPRRLRPRTDEAALRHRRHLFHHRECRKVREMCRMVREFSPQFDHCGRRTRGRHSRHRTMIDADHIVRGEGISWMRRYLGEDDERADPASRHRFRPRDAHHGHASAGKTRSGRRRPSFPRWAVRWDATSVRPPRFSAARESSSTFTRLAMSYFDVM